MAFHQLGCLLHMTIFERWVEGGGRCSCSRLSRQYASFVGILHMTALKKRVRSFLQSGVEGAILKQCHNANRAVGSNTQNLIT